MHLRQAQGMVLPILEEIFTLVVARLYYLAGISITSFQAVSI